MSSWPLGPDRESERYILYIYIFFFFTSHRSAIFMLFFPCLFALHAYTLMHLTFSLIPTIDSVFDLQWRCERSHRLASELPRAYTDGSSHARAEQSIIARFSEVIIIQRAQRGVASLFPCDFVVTSSKLKRITRHRPHNLKTKDSRLIRFALTSGDIWYAGTLDGRFVLGCDKHSKKHSNTLDADHSGKSINEATSRTCPLILSRSKDNVLKN